MTRRRGMVLVAVLGLISLPAALVVLEAASYHVRNRSNGSMVSSGHTREYLLHVPRSYDRTRPTPLVISMHGGAMWPAAQKETSRWNDAAERHGFIVVYPSGISNDGPRHWNADGGPGQKMDVQFISELIDTLRTRYTIDPTRIYANGLSNGAGMTFVLSCDLSDRIAAVGLVAAAHFLPASWCADRRPVPMIAFHGTADLHVPYTGGKAWMAPITFPNIPTWTKQWAERNRCAPSAIDAVVAPDVIRRAYAGCADGAAVVLYTIAGGGHTWPGGGPLPEWFTGRTSRSIDATNEMWAFFSAHQLRN
ncbi:MAG: extracellular catalytic domain type 1 short-chain-length polyhydroxyalkanoate depolymerase [Gemmatimonadaceae bacterium]